MKLLISEVQIIPIRPHNGLVAFASAVINDQFHIGNIAVYTSPKSNNGYRLVYPTKKLANGKQVDCFYPIHKDVEEEVSDAVIDKYQSLMKSFV